MKRGIIIPGPVTTVVNCKDDNYDVYIGRGSSFGNPFKIGKVHGTRLEVIAKFKTYVRSRPDFVERIKRELKGKTLGCHCKPLPCHGDVLAEIADED